MLSIRPIQRGGHPLHRAADNESVLGVRKLLQAGADPNTADREGRTPLHLAVQSDSPETVNYLLEAGGRSQRGRQRRGHAVALCGP